MESSATYALVVIIVLLVLLLHKLVLLELTDLKLEVNL